MIESREENTPSHRGDYRADFTALATPSQFISPREPANLISIGFTLTWSNFGSIGRISALALHACSVARHFVRSPIRRNVASAGGIRSTKRHNWRAFPCASLDGLPSRLVIRASRKPLEICAGGANPTLRDAGRPLVTISGINRPRSVRWKCQEQNIWRSSKHGISSNGSGP